MAVELTGVDAQMLRAYEASGLLEPFRTAAGYPAAAAPTTVRMRVASTLRVRIWRRSW